MLEQLVLTRAVTKVCVISLQMNSATEILRQGHLAYEWMDEALLGDGI